MVDTSTARTAIGIVGNVISFCLFLSPFPAFRTIFKEKAVLNFKPDPYIATVLNCAMWAFYGLPVIKSDSILVLSINAIGLVIELIYVAIFFVFSVGKQRLRIVGALLIEIVFMAAVILITFFAFHTPGKRAQFVGIICIIFNIIMYFAPLTVMRMVIKTKSVKYMPFFLSLANFCNGLIWAVYASLRYDFNVLFPNALGALSGLIQLILYATYYKTTKWDEDETSEQGASSEVQLSRVTDHE